MRRSHSISLASLVSLALLACAPKDAAPTEVPVEQEQQPPVEEQPEEPPAELESDEGVDTGEDAGEDAQQDSAELDAATKAALSETISAHLAELQECYEPELAKNPKLSGKMTYTITVERTGVVRTVLVDVDTVDSELVRACTVKKIESWRFDGSALEESADVTFSVAFAAI